MSDKKGWFKGTIFGAIGGAIAGLLFAPKSGKETREEIKQGAVKAKDDAAKRFEGVKEEVTDKAEEAKVVAEKYAGKTKRAAKKAVKDIKTEFSDEK